MGLTAVRLGRYELVATLGSGGMATVHLARVRGPGGFARVVAIKRLHPHHARDADLVAMLLDEARLLARVHHASVVSIEDVVVERGEVFLVMPFVCGCSLSAALTDCGGNVPASIASALACDALRGLHAAHEATDPRGAAMGIVHRDVSPENIVVGTDGVARVIDFGVAMAAERIQATAHGGRKGKLAFMSPEQIRGEPLDRRADVFAMGVVLWRLLSNEMPFSGGEPSDRLASIARGPDLGGHEPADAPLLDVARRAMSFDREARPATALEMVRALEDAARPSAPSRVAAWLEEAAPVALREMRAALGDADGAAPPSEPTTGAQSAEPLATPRLEAPLPRSARERAWRWVALALAFASGAILMLVGGARVLRSSQAGDAAEAMSPALAAWLAANPWGYCAAEPGQVVALCVSDSDEFSDPNGEGNFCFDDTRPGRNRLRRTYPHGITIDLGVHWDGARSGTFVTFGTTSELDYTCNPDAAGDRIEIGVDAGGHLFASAPGAERLVMGEPLAAGTYLFELQLEAEAHALFVNGRRVAHGSGGGPVAIAERWAPGLVLGESNQRWWVCGPGSPRRWLRMAPFFFHLRDETPAGDAFDLAGALERSEATVLLFDRRGAEDALWLPTYGADDAEWGEETRAIRAGRARGARLVDDVWNGCLSRGAGGSR